MAKAFVIAGVGSGSGKTTVTCSVILAMKKMGYRVQPFKVGPDYIDPQHLSKAAGRPCRNLDVWMMGPEGVRENFLRGCCGVDVCVVEGVGGVYDGLGCESFASTAHVARILGLPVILVLDAWGISRTAAALVKGIREFEDLDVRGVIFNFAGSERHCSLLRRVVESSLPETRVLGCIVRSKKGFVPERHLGILQAWELDWRDREGILLDLSKNIDVEGILGLAVDVEGAGVFPRMEGSLKIAVARDRAFSFLYTETLEALEESGCRIVFFSPVDGEGIPSDARGLILPGGYPELWADELEESGFFKELRIYADSGMPIYAECGGLIALSRCALYKGRRLPMAGVIPVEVEFGSRPLLGYAAGSARPGHPFLRADTVVKGHVFHYSRAKLLGEIDRAYRLSLPTRGMELDEGFVKGKVVATYLHTCWGYGEARRIMEGFLEAAV